MERWVKRVSLPFRPQMSVGEFTLAVIFLTFAVAALVAVTALNPMNEAGVFIMILIQAMMLVNAILPHLAATLWYRIYSPGVLTGTVLQIPFTIYLVHRAMENQLLSPGLLILAGLLAPVLMPVSAWLALKIGQRLFRLLPKTTIL